MKLLLVEDKEFERESLHMLLEAEGFDVTGFANPKEALGHLATERVDVVVTDLNMPEMDGIEVCQSAKDLYPDIDVVLVTAYGSIETAVKAMKQGAFHYIVKSPSVGEELLLTLERLKRQVALKRQVEELEGEVGSEDRLAGLVGQSPEMKEVFRLFRSVAPHDTTVLIRGETGTGKGLAGQAVHTLSPRRKEPFATVDCASLPETLLESELFGHIKGAFTGAHADRKGKIEAAGSGTIFLDEIGDLPMVSQPKLLRLLEQKCFCPIGSNKDIHSDARVVASTNRDLEEMVEAGEFRLDLYHRLNVVTVAMPPLRHRRQDIPLLADFLIRRVARRLSLEPKVIPSDTMAMILKYPWPGNVRQLVHALERAMVVGATNSIMAEDLPPEVREENPGAPGGPADSLAQAERTLITRVLSETGWNIHEASRRLDISRPTLYSKIKKHSISRDD